MTVLAAVEGARKFIPIDSAVVTNEIKINLLSCFPVESRKPQRSNRDAFDPETIHTPHHVFVIHTSFHSIDSRFTLWTKSGFTSETMNRCLPALVSSIRSTTSSET